MCLYVLSCGTSVKTWAFTGSFSKAHNRASKSHCYSYTGATYQSGRSCLIIIKDWEKKPLRNLMIAGRNRMRMEMRKHHESRQLLISWILNEISSVLLPLSQSLLLAVIFVDTDSLRTSNYAPAECWFSILIISCPFIYTITTHPLFREYM